MTEPLCPNFGSCGGCSFQDIDYSEQLEDKKRRLSEAIRFNNIQVFSGQEYNYRNRMDFVFHSWGLSLRERGSWRKMVNIEHCPISNNKLNEILTEVREFFKDVFYFDVEKQFGTYCYAVIRTTINDSSVSIVLNKKSKKKEEAVEYIKEFAKITSIHNVIVTYTPHNRNVSVSDEYDVIKGSDRLRSEYLGYSFYFPVQGFFQVNQKVAKKVHIYCRKLLSSPDFKNAQLLDLYGGVGTFGIINSPQFKEVLIIENYEPAIMAAQKNITENKRDNARTVSLDARNLKDMDLSGPLCIILDPPRSGMHPKTVKRLNELKPEVLIYVSCNPKHLGNDLLALDKYRIKSAALFDMFPQTPHMEAVVELVTGK